MSDFQTAWDAVEAAHKAMNRQYALEHRVCRSWHLRGWPDPDDPTAPIVAEFDVKIDARKAEARRRYAAARRYLDTVWDHYSRSMLPTAWAARRDRIIVEPDYIRQPCQ